MSWAPEGRESGTRRLLYAKPAFATGHSPHSLPCCITIPVGFHRIAGPADKPRLATLKPLMTKSILLCGTILTLAAAPALAADAAQPGANDKYRAQEASLDLFGSASVGQQTINNITGLRVNRDLRLGAGIGMNYFLTRNVGVGAEVYSENTAHSLVDSTSASVIARFPLGQSGIAPYVYGGGGRQCDPTTLWFAHAGAGLEYRFTPRVGAFVDARYVLTDGTANYGLGRIGVRFGF